MGKPYSLIKPITDRPGHDRRYAIDPAKIEKELGWKAATDWEEGLKKTIDWYISNIRWIENIRNGEYREYYKQMYTGK